MQNLNYATVLFMLSLICYLINKTNGQELNVCVDCSNYWDPACEVNRNDFVSDPVDESLIVRPGEDEQPDENIEDCSDYKITGNLQKFVCFLSITKGCGLVSTEDNLQNKYYLNYVCPICGMDCGCKLKTSGSSAVMNCYKLLAICFGIIMAIKYLY